jgi:hypothetical protein
VRMKFWIAAVVLAGAAIALTAPAQAQTAFEAGLRIAVKRGAPDHQCYANVFARHAERGQRSDGTICWYTKWNSTYRRDMFQSCSIKRGELADLPPPQEPCRAFPYIS